MEFQISDGSAQQAKRKDDWSWRNEEVMATQEPTTLHGDLGLFSNSKAHMNKISHHKDYADDLDLDLLEELKDHKERPPYFDFPSQ